MSHDIDEEISEEQVAEIEAILDELEEESQAAFSKLIQYLFANYSEQLDSEYLAINQILITLSSLTGELLAHIPEEDRDNIEGKVHDLITHRRGVMEGALEKAEGDIDLATVKPQGNC